MFDQATILIMEVTVASAAAKEGKAVMNHHTRIYSTAATYLDIEHHDDALRRHTIIVALG